MKNEFSGLINLFKNYLFYLFIFFITRLFFLFYFGTPEIIDERSDEILKALFLGARYDVIVLSYLFLPLYLIWIFLNLLPFKSVFNFSVLLNQIWFIFAGIVIITVVVADLAFYSFFQDHINILFFGFFEDDTAAILESIWKDYPVVPMAGGGLVYLYLLVFSTRRLFIRAKKFKRISNLKKLPLVIISLGLFIGAIRGGYGEFVLSPKFADFSSSEFINQLSRNGVMALEQTYQMRKETTSLNFNLANQLGYRKSIQDAFSDYLGLDLSRTPENELINLLWRKTTVNEKLENNKPHVIVILMESFGSFWLQYQNDQFDLLGNLKEHFDQDIYIPYTLPADNGTIGSLVGLATNIPHRRGARFLSESRYLDLALESGAHIPFQRRGYETHFLYGGKLSWRNIGRYFRRQGYDSVEGENALKGALSLQGKIGNEWGVYDEFLFDYALKKLDSNTPQFMFMLSTSNHPPFEVPATYKTTKLNLPPELDLRVNRERELLNERFTAYQYANQKLAEFISSIKEKYPNTIIAVTGDHNFFSFLTYESDEAYLKYTVPLYFYFPEKLKPKKYDPLQIAGHEDIMTTIYNRALSDTKFLSFGEDIFASNNPIAINGTVVATKKGIWYKNKYYSWTNERRVSPEPISEIQDLGLRYRSTLSVADFYLRYTFNQKRADSNRDRPE